MMGNKKGDVLIPEVMKIVLAVIVIVLLVFLAYQMYGIFMNKTRTQQAKASLDEISSIMANAPSEGFSKNYTLLSPDGYVLVGFPVTLESGPSNLPKQCLDNNWKNCLCFCEFNDFYKSDKDKIVLEDWIKKFSPVLRLIESYSAIKLYLGDFVSPLINSCNTNPSVCKETPGQVWTNSYALQQKDIGFWKMLINSPQQNNQVLAGVIESGMLIRVDTLIKERRTLRITKESGGFEIGVNPANAPNE